MGKSKTGREKAALNGHVGTGAVTSVTFSSDGTLLASGSRDKSIKLWDVKTRQEKATLAGTGFEVYSVAFSPDSTLLAAGGGTKRLDAGRLKSDGTIKLWDVRSGEAKATLIGHTDLVAPVTFSPDGKLLASGSLDSTIRLWDVESGAEKASLKGHAGTVWSVAFSPDGTLLASGSADGTIRLWDVKTIRERATLKGHTDQVFSVAFSPDGKTLASGSQDETIKLWDVSTILSRADLEAAAGHPTLFEKRDRKNALKLIEKQQAYLRYAKKLLADGNVEKAKERLNEIVRDFPGTPSAEEAGRLLKGLAKD